MHPGQLAGQSRCEAAFEDLVFLGVFFLVQRGGGHVTVGAVDWSGLQWSANFGKCAGQRTRPTGNLAAHTPAASDALAQQQVAGTTI